MLPGHFDQVCLIIILTKLEVLSRALTPCVFIIIEEILVRKDVAVLFIYSGSVRVV